MSVLKDSNRDLKNQMHKRDKSLLSAIHVCKVFFFPKFYGVWYAFYKAPLKLRIMNFFSNLRDFWDQVNTLCKKKPTHFFK